MADFRVSAHTTRFARRIACATRAHGIRAAHHGTLHRFARTESDMCGKLREWRTAQSALCVDNPNSTRRAPGTAPAPPSCTPSTAPMTRTESDTRSTHSTDGANTSANISSITTAITGPGSGLRLILTNRTASSAIARNISSLHPHCLASPRLREQQLQGNRDRSPDRDAGRQELLDELRRHVNHRIRQDHGAHAAHHRNAEYHRGPVVHHGVFHHFHAVRDQGHAHHGEYTVNHRGRQ